MAHVAPFWSRERFVGEAAEPISCDRVGSTKTHERHASADDASVPVRLHLGPASRADQGRRFDPQASARGRRPGGAWTLGRGPARRSGNTHDVVTLVERSSRLVMLVVRVRGKDTESVVGALSDQIQRLPGAMMDTLTWDRGTEMADHKKITIATDFKVYFCDPKSPWQRGTSANTDRRLLRQYLPKGTDLSAHSQHDLDAIALKLNSRPRKTLA
jgi:IS30 family transposase